MGNLIIGIICLLYGLFTLYLRIFKESKGLGKLENMKMMLGDKLGTLLHVFSYTILPICIGLYFIVRYYYPELEIFQE